MKICYKKLQKLMIDNQMKRVEGAAGLLRTDGRSNLLPVE